MLFTQSFVLFASLISSAIAQTSNRISFTQTPPSSVKAGSSVTLKWSGGNDQPVTITLKQGDPNNLQTVSLITGNGMNGQYVWTPSTSLPSSDNYALQIIQDDTDINYTGLFAITGGSSSSSGSATASATSSAASTAASSGSTGGAILGGSSGSNSSAPSNTTAATTTIPAKTVTGGAVGTGVAASGASGISSGTGIPMSRNTTLSKATLSKTSATTAATTTAASTTSGEGSSSSSTGAGSASSPSPTSAAIQVVTNLALVLAGLAAVFFLG
ncbi:MAG: hypothetical protein OHK93_002575 [Ramalina farinacea]|uniref:Yeast cell wall synthesis Kre9/Knh1-like N-terminal domain-containing protein n=1 Tax=Ramalina farinacea TaxID=258253 RepID=A0AA43QUB1_9LECA|nr:hypothetical protein [Ramalina farinacea]